MLKSSSSALIHAFIFVSAISGPALGQSFSATATSSSTASLPATSTAPIFTYPSPVMAETPIVSFQDVMRLSWSPLENNYTATLQILCWDRDTSLFSAATLERNLTDQLYPNITSFDVSFSPYRYYTPCIFLIRDDFGGSVTDMSSNYVAINQTASPLGAATWSLEYPAPTAPRQDAIQAVNSDTVRSGSFTLAPRLLTMMAVALVVAVMA